MDDYLGICVLEGVDALGEEPSAFGKACLSPKTAQLTKRARKQAVYSQRAERMQGTDFMG